MIYILTFTVRFLKIIAAYSPTSQDGGFFFQISLSTHLNRIDPANLSFDIMCIEYSDTECCDMNCTRNMVLIGCYEKLVFFMKRGDVQIRI